ncbi:MAG: hypothetical protein JWQ40_2802 [Segetibacter sp.]|jgi:hypothetical protein|nr:hypothetical protein [Segetibacter sp.]
MKQVTLKLFIAAFITICMIVSCQKQSEVQHDFGGNNQLRQTEALKQSLDKGAQGSSTCLSCDTSSKTYDLINTIKAFPFKSGLNVVSDLGNGYKVVANIRDGKTIQWTLQGKSGETYLPQSTQKMGRVIIIIGRPGDVVRLCWTTSSGRRICVVVVL